MLRCLRRGSITLFGFKTLRPVARTYNVFPQKYLETQKRWQRNDGVSQEWELIYKAPIDQVIGALSTFITITPIVLIAGAVKYYFSNPDFNEPVKMGDVVIAENMNEFSVYAVSFVIFHLVLKSLTSRWVVRLYKSEDQYLAIIRGSLYHQLKHHKFSVKEFERRKPGYFVPWNESRFTIGGRKAIILEEYFKTPRHFNELVKKNIIKPRDKEMD